MVPTRRPRLRTDSRLLGHVGADAEKSDIAETLPPTHRLRSWDLRRGQVSAGSILRHDGFAAGFRPPSPQQEAGPEREPRRAAGRPNDPKRQVRHYFHETLLP